ncbi:MAG: heparinase II/III family protein, partial [Desulfomonilaceae bacterium]
MKDPLLPGSDFERDIILFRSTMVKPEHIGYLGNFSLADDKIIIRGTNRLNLNINLKHSDLSIFNSLAVTLRNLSSHELLVEVKLIHGICEGDEPLKSISSSGGREVLVPGPITTLSFPFECFGTYGKPSGWSNVRELEINFSHDKFFTEYENIEIEFHRIEGERRSIPQGPRLTPDGLENQLSGNIDFDETLLISNVKHGLRSRGTGVRRLGYITPFTMLDPGLYTPPPHYYSPDTSPEIISGRIMGQNLPENIPWNANPVGELEWTHFLNRHHFVRSMILEFLKTGKKFVVERVASIVSDWILKCPVPVGSNGGAGPTWESLTVAWRLREWFWITGIMWPNPWFPNTVKNLMLRSIWEHAQSLMDHQGHPNNWIMIESCAMVLSGLLFPSFRDAAKWIETGLGRLVNEHKRQFFPDGAHFELSPLYHAICIDALLEVRRVAELTGESLPALFYKPLEQGFDYLMDLARPDFTWPSINDSGGVDRSYCQLFFNAASVFHRPDFEWVASRGSSGAPPKRKAIRLFGDAGICVIKTADKDDCQWALLRSGPAGAFHVHDDLLSIEIFDNESLWLVDPGITKYAPGILTSYYRSALAHNVLVVDGVEPLRSGRPIIERN